MLRQSGFIALMFSGMLSLAYSQPETYKNPVIPGFHPDPSICRAGDDYYLVTSTFEWFPGIPVFHSRDLVNWNLIGYGITRPDQVELPAGLGDSRGIYAVTIHYHDGMFYLITTCVQCGGNFFLTAKDPSGPWSGPVWLHSRGIDPSLFWDDDGKCYYVGHANISGITDWPDKNGVWMQELDPQQGKLIGPQKQLTHGHASNARWTEGPHLFKIDGIYMLLVAEGGTGFHHAVTVFHSENVWGPYIPCHSNPVLTHRHLGLDFPVHSVGHADLVQTAEGEWWAVSLGKRKYEGYTLLARETFLTPVRFENQEGLPTPVFNPGEGKVPFEHKRPGLPWNPWPSRPVRDHFQGETLALEWNFLRTPLDKWYKLDKGCLGIRLRPEVIDSLVNPSLIAQRIRHHHFYAMTSMDFSGKKDHEEAGLVLYRKSTHHIQLIKRRNELLLIRTENGRSEILDKASWKSKKVVLKVEADGIRARFSFGPDETHLQPVGGVVDLTVLSDEKAGGFNGPYIGMYATSNGNESHEWARFFWFEYAGQTSNIE